MTMIKIIRRDDDYDIGISSYDRQKIKEFISNLTELEYLARDMLKSYLEQ